MNAIQTYHYFHCLNWFKNEKARIGECKKLCNKLYLLKLFKIYLLHPASRQSNVNFVYVYSASSKTNTFVSCKSLQEE